MSSVAPEKPTQKASPRVLFLLMLFPLFMAFAYPAAYVAAFHSPAPHQMSLEVIDNTPLAQEVVQGLKIKGGDALDVTTVPTVDAAKQDVLARDARAAYSPSTGNLYVASAGSVQATQAAKSIFTEVAQQTGKTFKVQELKPTAQKDTTGTGYMYMVVASIIAGYITATMITNLGKRLSIWTKLAVQVVMAVAAAVTTTFITFGLYGLYEEHLVLAALVVFASFLSASILQLGLSSVLGTAATVVGILMFVVLGLPAAGVAVPADMMPGFFRVLHSVLPSGAAAEIMQRTLYFDGHGVAPWILQLVLWVLVGLGLLWAASLRSPEPEEAKASGPDPASPRRHDDDAAPRAAARSVPQPATSEEF